jgi:hypothetical protein
MKLYSYLADAVVIVHFAFVAVVVFGLAAILIGAALRWGWVRNFWFRAIHLAMIGFVAVEAMFGVVCPLTTLEHKLRGMAGETIAAGSFMGRLFHDLLFYEAEPWVFTMLHIGFAVLVLATFLLVPPRWPRTASSPPSLPKTTA